MPDGAFSRELEAVTSAVLKAGELVLEHYARFKAIPDAPFDISTSADLASQELLLESLLADFPNDAYLCEEDTPLAAGVPSSGTRLWMIDPIDGTRGFARKTGEFSVMVGLVVENEPVVGIVYQPVSRLLVKI